MVQLVKSLPATWEIWVQSLGREDPLEKGMATHSSSFAWRIPWTEEPGESTGSQRVRHDRVTNTSRSLLSHKLLYTWEVPTKKLNYSRIFEGHPWWSSG